MIGPWPTADEFAAWTPEQRCRFALAALLRAMAMHLTWGDQTTREHVRGHELVDAAYVVLGTGEDARMVLSGLLHEVEIFTKWNGGRKTTALLGALDRAYEALADRPPPAPPGEIASLSDEQITVLTVNAIADGEPTEEPESWRSLDDDEKTRTVAGIAKLHPGRLPVEYAAMLGICTETFLKYRRRADRDASRGRTA